MVEKDLNEILARRAAPQTPPGLAERIIAAAQPRPVRRGFDFGRWLEEFTEGFALPQPALALFVILVFGFYLGVNIDASAQEPVAEDLAAYLDINNEGGLS